MSHCPGCIENTPVGCTAASMVDRALNQCPGCGCEEEIAQLKAALDSANAEAERLRDLGEQLRGAAGEPNCHLRALEVIQKAGSDLAAARVELQKEQEGNRVLQREIAKVVEHFGMPGDGRLLSEQWIEAYEKVNKERDRANEIAEDLLEALRTG